MSAPNAVRDSNELGVFELRAFELWAWAWALAFIFGAGLIGDIRRSLPVACGMAAGGKKSDKPVAEVTAMVKACGVF